MRKLAYLSFDTVPSPKGASTHIQAFTRALAEAYGSLELVTVGAGSEPSEAIERWPGVFHSELPAVGISLIDRVLCFRRFLVRWLVNRKIEAIQFRSIFEGLPLLNLPGKPRLIFEVNGLPSIELKYRYPRVEDDRELMGKLVAQERACLNAAHLIVTPSAVTERYLFARYGIPAAKIKVIPNGVDLDVFKPGAQARDGSEPMRLLYFGTLSPWQGVDLAIRALAQVPAILTIIGAASSKQREALTGLASKLGVANRVRVLPPMPQSELIQYLHASDAVLAPLTLNDRNVTQGCCPLKILEAMAAGVPVIASDLPVVRELGCDGEHFVKTKPGSVDGLAEAIARLQADPRLASEISRRARLHIEQRFTWQHSARDLISAYEELLQDAAVPARS